jgi:RNA polymerase sigma-70 factor (ECF subfamily)
VLSRVQGSYRASIDDLTQETFVRAWKGYDRLDHSQNVAAWIGCIAQRVLCDFHRRTLAHQRLDCSLEMDDGKAHDLPDTHIDMQLTCVEESGAIARAYQQLPPEDQQVMQLLLQEYTVSEVAAALSLDLDACKTRVKRARRRFRRFYAEV